MQGESSTASGANLEVGTYAGVWFSNYFHDFYGEPTTEVRQLDAASPAAGLRLAYFPHTMFGGEAEFQYTLAKLREPASDTPIFGFRAHAIAQYPAVVTPFAVLGVGLAHLSSPTAALGSDTDVIFHLGVGGKYQITSSVALRADARFLRGPAAREDDPGANYAEIMLGVSFTPRFKKSAPGPEPELDPYPEPDPDPEPDPEPDADGDGLLDKVDKCPDKAEDKDGFQDDDGCPDLDDDEDGVPDSEDKCPNEPEDKDGHMDRDGCDDPDNDNDGIPDVIDQCAIEPETINGNKDEDGCPDSGDSLVMLMPARIEVFESVHFRGNSDKILKKSLNVLGQVASTMRANRDILKLRITVHVHPRGANDVSITKKRAEAVRKWMTDWGVEPERLDIKGMGGRVPLVPVKERGAKQLNDRVEFTIIEKKINK